MHIPTIINDDLDFTEAIAMVELIEQSQQLIPALPTAAGNAGARMLFHLDQWHCVHIISDTVTTAWALILQRADTAHFAVVCGHVDIGNAPASTHAVGSLLLSNWRKLLRKVPGSDSLVSAMQQWQPHPSVPYGTLTQGGPFSPGGARVYQPWFAAAVALQVEIALFFGALSSLRFVQPLLADLQRLHKSQQPNYRTAIAAALTIRFGTAASQVLAQNWAAPSDEAIHSGSAVISTAFLAAEAAAAAQWVFPEAGFTLSVTGHGTGGAVAALCALGLRQSWDADLEFPLFHLNVYTFGSPKVGNQPFVDFYNRQLQGDCHRVENLLDSMIYGPPNEINLSSALSASTSAGEQAAPAWMPYHHVGAPFRHPGVGNAPALFNFALGVKPSLLPFAHDPAGYKALLLAAQTSYSVLQQMAQQFDEQKHQLVGQVQQLADFAQSQFSGLFNNLRR